MGESDSLSQETGRIKGVGDPATIRLSGDRDRFSDGRAGVRGLPSTRRLGRAGDELLAGRLRDRRPHDLGRARDEGMLALCIRRPIHAKVPTHIEPEFPETGAGCTSEPRGLRHAVPALQRNRGKLHGDDGRGLGCALPYW